MIHFSAFFSGKVVCVRAEGCASSLPAAVGKRDAIPLAAALIKCRVHRGDSDQDSRGDGCLLSSLTAIASFFIYKCKQTGAKSFFLLSFSLHCTDSLPRSLLTTCSLPPKLLLHFLAFLQGLDLSSRLLCYNWGLGRGLASSSLLGTWGLEIAYSHKKLLFFSSRCYLASPFRVTFWTC